jgi:lysophospholipase L1-like esterase
MPVYTTDRDLLDELGYELGLGLSRHWERNKPSDKDDHVQTALGVVFVASVVFAMGMLLRSRLVAGATSKGQSLCTQGLPCRVAAIGNSLTAAQNGYVSMLNEALPNASITNMGVVSQGSAAIKNRLLQNVLGHGYHDVIILAGINDVGRANAAEYIVNNLREMVQRAKADGLRVILCQLTPYHAAKDVVRSVNATIRSQGRSWGADVIVDTYSPLADWLGNLKSSLVGDQMGLHPTRAGQRLMADAILEAYR